MMIINNKIYYLILVKDITVVFSVKTLVERLCFDEVSNVNVSEAGCLCGHLGCGSLPCSGRACDEDVGQVPREVGNFSFVVRV